MNDKSRNKKEIYEIVSKNRLIFALAGSVIAIIAFFTPMFHFDHINMGFHEYGSLWIFGLYDWELETISSEFGWLSVVDEENFVVALISIVSTVIMSVLVLGTIITSGITLIRKRKEGVYSSRLLLYFSIGLFVAVNAYMFALMVDAFFGNTDLFWLRVPSIFRMGAVLFIIGAGLIFIGYTVKIKAILKMISLFVAGSLIHYGAYNLTWFSLFFISFPPPIDPSSVVLQVNRLIIPGTIALLCALVIVVINYILYRRTKKKAAIVK